MTVALLLSAYAREILADSQAVDAAEDEAYGEARRRTAARAGERGTTHQDRLR